MEIPPTLVCDRFSLLSRIRRTYTFHNNRPQILNVNKHVHAQLCPHYYSSIYTQNSTTYFIFRKQNSMNMPNNYMK